MPLRRGAITTAMLAGLSQAAAYGRYDWHALADQAVGNYLTEAIVPE